MEAPLYNREGKEAGKIAVPTALFGQPWNPDLVEQVARAMRSNLRAGTADSKGRGEVRGGGKKPWRQKGTGRARHGSSRSPIWRGGGVTHGPLAERNYTQKVNRQMKKRALLSVLSQKFRDAQVIFVDDLGLEAGKTRAARSALTKLAKNKNWAPLGYKKGKRALVSLPAADQASWRSLRNLPTVGVAEARNLNPLELLTYQFVLITKPAETFKALEARAK